MRILITGASGFLGSRISRLLFSWPNRLLLLAKDKRDHSLLGRYAQNIIIGDLNNMSRFEKKIKVFDPQVCIHLAWEGIPDFSFGHSKRNLDNSLQLINFIANDTKCKKIIISGTCFEYGKTKGICRESDRIDINSFFSWAKYALYLYSDFICKRAGIDLIWFRIFYVYGPGQRRESLIPALARTFRNKFRMDIKNPLNANDFVHVDDVAEAFRIAVHKKIKSGIYNLGSGKSTKVIDICRLVEKQVLGTSIFSDKISLNRSYGEAVDFWADINKTKRTLSWGLNISLRRGIVDYLKHEASDDYITHTVKG